MNKIILPDGVKKIFNVFDKEGYEAYIVGGCVRDYLLSKEPKDWDICTDALPKVNILLFSGKYRVAETGLKHGTITVIVNDEPYEITTFREDSLYSDSRRPDTVTFKKEITEDLKRRDFTINALAYNPSKGIIDCFNGMQDLEAKIIRCVGDPSERFSEDALRILRALRFSSQLGFVIEKETSKQIHEEKELLLNISKERIVSEFIKILTGENVEYVLRNYSDVFELFISEISAMKNCQQNNIHHIFNVWEHTIKAVSQSKNDAEIRTSLFFHDIGKPSKKTTVNEIDHFYKHQEESCEITIKSLKKLKACNKFINNVSTLVLCHDFNFDNLKAVGRFITKYPIFAEKTELFDKLAEIRKSDIIAQSNYEREKKLAALKYSTELFRQFIDEKKCFLIKDMEISGNDLKSLGITPGPSMGKILKTLFSRIVDGELKNEKSVLIDEAIKMYKK